MTHFVSGIIGLLLGISITLLGIKNAKPNEFPAKDSIIAKVILGKPECVEYDTLITIENKRVILHFRDCQNAGTISIQSNKPIFGGKETALLMGADNVIGLDGVGYGWRLNNESDRRTCTIKWQIDRKAVTDKVIQIIQNWN